MKDQSEIVSHEEDFHAWAEQQAGFLARGEWEHVDGKKLSEEIASIGMREKNHLRSTLRKIVIRLLCIEFSSRNESAVQISRWLDEIDTLRETFINTINESPSLKSQIPEMFKRTWGRCVQKATTKIAEIDGRTSINQSDLERAAEGGLYRLQDCLGFDPERHSKETTADDYDGAGRLLPKSVEIKIQTRENRSP